MMDVRARLDHVFSIARERSRAFGRGIAAEPKLCGYGINRFTGAFHIQMHFPADQLISMDAAQHDADLECVVRALAEAAAGRRQRLLDQVRQTAFLVGENAATGERRLMVATRLYQRTKYLEIYFDGNPDAWFAADAYGQLLTEDPANAPALAGLARVYLAGGAIDEAKETLALVPEAKHNDSAVAAARAALELAEQAKTLGPVAELEQKVAANPLDHQARFDLAVALNASGKRAEAVDQLMEIVKRDRKWNEDGARKQLVQFFEAWGPTDEATVEGRKRLSTILFS